MIGAIRAGVAGMSIGQRIGGAALFLALWLAPAGAVWLHMAAKASAAREVGAAAERANCAQAQTSALAKAIADARTEWERTQTAIDRRAETDSREIARILDDARRDAAKLSQDLKAHAQANPLPADCRADPERVRMYNRSRRGDAAEE